MSRRAKHRYDGKPLATEVPTNAAADVAAEGLQDAPTGASTHHPDAGPHDAGPSIANPSVAADAESDRVPLQSDDPTGAEAAVDGFDEEREPESLLPEGTQARGPAPLP